MGAFYRHWLAGPAEGRSSPPRDLCTGVFAISPAQTVLIVDDNQRNREALAELLKDDCDLLLARDGPTAVEIAMREDISLVLLAVPLAGTGWVRNFAPAEIRRSNSRHRRYPYHRYGTAGS